MRGDALAAVVHLDSICGDADIDPLADKGARHRVERLSIST